MNTKVDEGKQWISVDDQMPEYSAPVLVFCAKSGYTRDGLKVTVASFVSKEELEESMEEYNDQDDTWCAEIGLSHGDYGSWLMTEEVTHWMPLPAPPAQGESHE